MKPLRLGTLRALSAAAMTTILALPALAQQPAQNAATLDAIRSRGSLTCGVNTGLAGFAQPDSQGRWQGFDVEYCRALAVALFNDANKVRYVPTTAKNRFTALQSGEIDVLPRNTTATLSRDTSLGLDFPATNFYDGQGFMVKASLGVSSAKELDGATVCVQPGTTTEKNLADFFRASNMKLNPVVIESVEEIRNAMIGGRCDAFTVGTSTLAAFRAGLGDRARDFVVLPELISKEPLGPVVRKGDDRFYDVVRWTQNVLHLGEEFGITRQTLDAAMQDTRPDVQRLLGQSGDFGTMLGLSPDWAVRILRAVGNYAEIWERHVAPMGLPRGKNQLHTAGGLQYSPPIR